MSIRETRTGIHNEIKMSSCLKVASTHGFLQTLRLQNTCGEKEIDIPHWYINMMNIVYKRFVIVRKIIEFLRMPIFILTPYVRTSIKASSVELKTSLDSIPYPTIQKHL